MEFINPGLLWFMAGGLIPIIIHLLHKQRYKRIQWAAMQFLLNAIKKTQRRLRLENLLLLLIRIIIMVLLALAIARPFFRESPLGPFGAVSTDYIFVIDNSFSMGYKKAQATLLDIAKKSSTDLIESLKLSEEDRLDLVLLSEYPEVRLSQVVKKETLKQAINEIEIADYGTSIYNTMQLVKNIFEKSQTIQRKVYIFSDMQRNSWQVTQEEEQKKFADLLKKLSQNPNNFFFIVDVGDEDPQNNAIISLNAQEGIITTRAKTIFNCDLYNFSSTSVDLNVNFYVDGDRKDSKSTTLNANSIATCNFEYTFHETGPHYIKVESAADNLSKDDARYLAVNVKDNIRVLAVDGDPGPGLSGETRLFQMALDPAEEASFYKITSSSTETVSFDNLQNYDCVLLANVQYLTDDKIEAIKNYLRQGAGLFITLGSKIQKDHYNSELFDEGRGFLPAELESIAGDEKELVDRGSAWPVYLDKVKSDHYIFRTFKGKLEGALKQLATCQYYKLQKNDASSVIACYTNADSSPAFIEKNFGDGKVLLFSSTIDADWNYFPTQNPFLPLIHDIVRYLSSKPPSIRNIFIGESIVMHLPIEKYSPEYRLAHIEPFRAGEVTITPSQPDPASKLITITYPSAQKKSKDSIANEGFGRAGVYSLSPSTHQESQVIAYFACNIRPYDTSDEEIRLAEGNLEKITREQLQTLFPDFKCHFIGERVEAGFIITPSSGSLWKHLLYVLLGFLLLESALASLFGRRKE